MPNLNAPDRPTSPIDRARHMVIETRACIEETEQAIQRTRALIERTHSINSAYARLAQAIDSIGKDEAPKLR